MEKVSPAQKSNKRNDIGKELKDVTIAATMIKDYDDKNPSRGRGGKRSTFDGATHVQQFTQGRSREDDRLVKMMDFIEFAKMKETEVGTPSAPKLPGTCSARARI